MACFEAEEGFVFRLPWVHPNAGVLVKGWIVAVLIVIGYGSGGFWGHGFSVRWPKISPPTCSPSHLGWCRGLVSPVMSLSIHQTSRPGGQIGGTGSGLGTVAGAVEGAACGSVSSSSGLRNEGCLL